MFDPILIRDEKAANTAGGTFTQGAWRTRDLNVKVYDQGGHATLAANQILLVNGTYLAKIKCPCFTVDLNYARLQNITDGATLLLGTNEVAPAATGQASSWIVGKFVIAGGPKLVEVQHWCQTTRATDGFGVKCNLDATRVELYTIAELVRIL